MSGTTDTDDSSIANGTIDYDADADAATDDVQYRVYNTEADHEVTRKATRADAEDVAAELDSLNGYDHYIVEQVERPTVPTDDTDDYETNAARIAAEEDDIIFAITREDRDTQSLAQFFGRFALIAIPMYALTMWVAKKIDERKERDDA